MKTKVKVNGVKYKLEVLQDECPENPRNWDNVGQMFCFHGRYELGDKHSYHSSDFDNWDEFKQELINEYNPVAILPLYLYDHSGITISTRPFGCRWDSGQVGFILLSKETAERECLLPENYESYLIGETRVYDQYLTGDVFGFVLKTKNPDGTKEEDSCWGFYGCDPLENGMSDNFPAELVNALQTN